MILGKNHKNSLFVLYRLCDPKTIQCINNFRTFHNNPSTTILIATISDQVIYTGDIRDDDDECIVATTI